jgi:exodeoxyribonuclease-5
MAILDEIKQHLEAYAQKIGFVKNEEGIRLSQEQEKVLTYFKEYLQLPDPNKVFILSGAAGTGKTTLLKYVIKEAEKLRFEVVLLAPTGRAAKVITTKTDRNAQTIHRHIYRIKEKVDKNGQLSSLQFSLRTGKRNANTLYIVDEASMIGGKTKYEGLFGKQSLLSDFFQYVSEGSEKNTILFVGDHYQLPPVGELISPALSSDELYDRYDIEIAFATLKEVRRQTEDSSILSNATRLRRSMEMGEMRQWSPNYDGKQLVRLNNQEEALDLFVALFKEDPDNTIFLTLSNQAAARLNAGIRKRLYGDGNAQPQIGEKLLVVKNHYFKAQSEEVEYLANGESLLLNDWNDKGEEIADIPFCNGTFEYVNEQGEKSLYQAKFFKELLYQGSPNLPTADFQKLFHSRRLRIGKKLDMTTDAYLNALQLKFGYAITCHKAQGGEWKRVFILREYNKFDDLEFARWWYTALTRSSDKVFVV